MKPTKNNIIITPCESESVTTSGIILMSRKPSDFAEVLFVADNVDEVKVGDKITYNKFATKPLENNMYIININEVFGVVNK